MEEKKSIVKAVAAKKDRYLYAKGARKTSVAQVRLFKGGQGEITVNGKKSLEYFPTEVEQTILISPLKVTSHEKDVDLEIKTSGGGMNSQAEACRHGIARVLELLDKELRPVLKAEGFLTRDPRVKERKKPGLRRARRAPQWSKR
jgi:small subunit ribosomal protein S9